MLNRIEVIELKKLIGMHLTMCMANNKTVDLWKKFMPRKKEISAVVNSNLYSIQVYDAKTSYDNFNAHTMFEKWAAVEVEKINIIPNDMQVFELPAGAYAVFIHKGLPSAFPSTLKYIFEIWLPLSGYIVDHRPQFEILGEKYKNNSEESEEEVWIPVIKK